MCTQKSVTRVCKTFCLCMWTLLGIIDTPVKFHPVSYGTFKGRSGRILITWLYRNTEICVLKDLLPSFVTLFYFCMWIPHMTICTHIELEYSGLRPSGAGPCTGNIWLQRDNEMCVLRDLQPGFITPFAFALNNIEYHNHTNNFWSPHNLHFMHILKVKSK